MIWETLAEGTNLETLEAVKERRLAKGTRVRFIMTVRTPLGIPTARAFDLPGAEVIFRRVMPEGMKLLDVHSPDNNEQVVIDTEVITNPIVTTVAIVTFVKAHWLTLSLIGIGVTLALGALITSIRIQAEMIPLMWAMLLLAIVIIAIVLIIAKFGLKTPKFALGG